MSDTFSAKGMSGPLSMRLAAKSREPFLTYGCVIRSKDIYSYNV